MKLTNLATIGEQSRITQRLLPFLSLSGLVRIKVNLVNLDYSITIIKLTTNKHNEFIDGIISYWYSRIYS